MTEEFDEDVVFENSPLFQYLHDLGHTDFEACPTASQEEEYGEPEEAVDSPDEDPRKTRGGLLWWLAEALWRWSPFHQAAATHKLGQELDGVFGQYSVRCILDQDVLLQEDVELIELLDPSLLTAGCSTSQVSASRGSSLPRPSLIARPSLWDTAGLLGLTAVLLGLCSSSGGLWSLAAAPWGLALLGWAGLRTMALWRRGHMQRAVHSRAMQLQALVHDGKLLTGLSRKALRLVQETEVISRGFTLVSAASTFSRAGPEAMPRGQQLIGLRKALYRALRSAFRASRRATCHMLKAFPLNSEIDNVTNYVSAVPLKELGLGLGIEHLSDEQAQELTDDYSLPALKMLFQLWVGQSSECFRRMALLLSPQRLEEAAGEVERLRRASSSSTPPPPLLYRAIATVTEPLQQALAGCLGEVQRSYDFHRHFETQARSNGVERTGRARETCRELNMLHTSIRSLQLHLKALLSEMIILEDDLEKLMVSGEPAELSYEGYQNLSERLHQLQPHMQASAGCWEDTVCQVDRMLRRVGPGGAKDPQPCQPPVCEVPPPPLPPLCFPLILDQDPVPEELEWEAYVSDSDSDGEGRDSWSDMLSPEERERQRREREESRRVLSELKAVLGFRASEEERMKRKQLLFNEQAATAPSALSEGSGVAPQPSEAAAPLGTMGGSGEGNHLSVRPDGQRQQEEEADCSGSDGGLMVEPTTEFSCGSEVDGELAGASVCRRGGGGASELHQYDGLEEGGEGEGQNGLDCFLSLRDPALSVMDRLTEIHGSQALSFSSALAAQAAARSHSLVKMQEQTFGDDDDDEGDDDCEEEEEGAKAKEIDRRVTED